MENTKAEQKPPRKIIVLNDTDPGRLLHYASTAIHNSDFDGQKAEVQINTPHTLIPGVNVIDEDAAFLDFKTTGTWKAHAKTGKLRIVEMPSKPGLMGFAEDEAMTYVNKCYKLGLLDEWASVETRPEVIRELKTRSAEVRKELDAPNDEDRVFFRKQDARHAQI